MWNRFSIQVIIPERFAPFFFFLLPSASHSSRYGFGGGIQALTIKPRLISGSSSSPSKNAPPSSLPRYCPIHKTPTFENDKSIKSLSPSSSTGGFHSSPSVTGIHWSSILSISNFFALSCSSSDSQWIVMSYVSSYALAIPSSPIVSIIPSLLISSLPPLLLVSSRPPSLLSVL